jgi:hypothetical protein
MIDLSEGTFPHLHAKTPGRCQNRKSWNAFTAVTNSPTESKTESQLSAIPLLLRETL